ncbi:uncharacterized protein N7511_009584 [Penicillium nucicola]|uniref:uncharacterized protein n=1 Tax=Penicillium nucicola TaxID=1850975 RepID=UPI00254520A1|nr:uncharacterized protein N7511_009584 [Penicillium nucicola]KAJ5747888.1 hypothetical protein N7511_009584 [Penicillium nucicola]
MNKVSFMQTTDPAIVIAIETGESYIVWDLKAVCHLMRLLKLWALNKVPGHIIGAFLKLILYGRDYHLNEILTKMVTEGKSNVYIAREVMAFYQIWDDNYRFPLWTTLVDDDGADEIEYRPQPPLKKAEKTQPLAEVDFATTTARAVESTQRAKVKLIRTGWPAFLSDLTDTQIDELTVHVENGEKGIYGPSLPVPRNPQVIEELRSLDRHKKDTREDLEPIQFNSAEYSLTNSAPQRAVWDLNKPLPLPLGGSRDAGVQTFTRDGSRWL